MRLGALSYFFRILFSQFLIVICLLSLSTGMQLSACYNKEKQEVTCFVKSCIKNCEKKLLCKSHSRKLRNRNRELKKIFKKREPKCKLFIPRREVFDNNFDNDVVRHLLLCIFGFKKNRPDNNLVV